MLLDHLLIFQTLTNGAKKKLDHLLLHLVNGLLWKTNDESGTPRSQSGWKTSWAKKDDKEDQLQSRVEDYFNHSPMGKKEAGSSPSFIGKMAACGKTNDESGTPRSQSGWKTSWAKKDDKEDQCASRVEDSSNTNQCVVDGDLRFILKDRLSLILGWKTFGPRRMTKKINVAIPMEESSNTNQWQMEAGSSPPHLVKGLLRKTNDESGTPRSQSGSEQLWPR
ncbi:hypothetical protein Tco_1430230 [Tanacetum coccineum]